MSLSRVHDLLIFSIAGSTKCKRNRDAIYSYLYIINVIQLTTLTTTQIYITSGCIRHICMSTRPFQLHTYIECNQEANQLQQQQPSFTSVYIFSLFLFVCF